VIQVDAEGQNSIVIFGGANREISEAQVDDALATAGPNDMVLIQNEINGVPYLLRRAAERGVPAYFNTAPMTGEVPGYPLDLVHTFFVNETEGGALTGQTAVEGILGRMLEMYPEAHVVLTLGSRGVAYADRERTYRREAERKVRAVDTTGAGDTFVGYYAAAVARGLSVPEALAVANLAAACCVTKPGAADSIPRSEELEEL